MYKEGRLSDERTSRRRRRRRRRETEEEEGWRSDSKMLPSLKVQNERSMSLFKCAPQDESWLV